jgi:hypothetical protein
MARSAVPQCRRVAKTAEFRHFPRPLAAVTGVRIPLGTPSYQWLSLGCCDFCDSDLRLGPPVAGGIWKEQRQVRVQAAAIGVDADAQGFVIAVIGKFDEAPGGYFMRVIVERPEFETRRRNAQASLFRFLARRRGRDGDQQAHRCLIHLCDPAGKPSDTQIIGQWGRETVRNFV